MGNFVSSLGDLADDFYDAAREFVGKASEKVEDVAREASSTARELTGNSLGIPGLDMGILKGDPAPVTIAAMVAGGATLAGGAFGAQAVGTAAAADAGAAAGAGDAFGTLGEWQAGTEALGTSEAAAAGGTGAAKFTALEGAGEAVKDAATVAPQATGSPIAQAGFDGFGTGATPPPTDDGTLSQISSWATKNPRIASAMLTGVGMTVAGAAKGALDYATMKEKSQLDRDTLLQVAREKPALYQQFIQASSAGGGGVTVPFTAPTAPGPLMTTSGTPVFGARGIIGSRVGG